MGGSAWVIAGTKPGGGAGRPALPGAEPAADAMDGVGRDVLVAPQATAWTEERRFEDYSADGDRIEYVVTSSSDCGTVTNSVSIYDLLGRLVTSAVPGANGATLVTSNAYNARNLVSDATASSADSRSTGIRWSTIC